jgi:hypothetical protein
MQKFAFYVGDWDCQLVQPDGESQKVSVEVRPALGGSWLSVRVYGADGKRATEEFKGWDAEHHQYVHVFVAPGAWGYYTSTGWEGDRMIALGDPSAHPRGRTVFTRLAADRFSHELEEDAGDGKGFVEVFTKTCRKRL